jgi:hypothetical protein
MRSKSQEVRGPLRAHVEPALDKLRTISAGGASTLAEGGHEIHGRLKNAWRRTSAASSQLTQMGDERLARWVREFGGDGDDAAEQQQQRWEDASVENGVE